MVAIGFKTSSTKMSQNVLYALALQHTGHENALCDEFEKVLGKGQASSRPVCSPRVEDAQSEPKEETETWLRCSIESDVRPSWTENYYPVRGRIRFPEVFL